MTISRRTFLNGSLALLLGSTSFSKTCAKTSFSSYPFKLGVASGYPRPDSVVLWTRLAPEPIKDGGGLSSEPLEVKWEIALDEGFHKVMRSGKKIASARYAHSVHVQVPALRPSTTYYYRFFAGDAVSPVGQTRTAPAPESLSAVSFSFASCQMYEQGYFTAHKHMAQEDLDLVLFLGDYIYEHSWGNNLVRKHEGPEVYSLNQYRNRYACYKMDPDLQACHARFPWVVTWDDHEVDNDYANDLAEDLESNFLKRRAAAYQAFYEHMPLPETFAPHNSDMQIYQALDFGKMTRFHVLDDRQYRDHEVCPKPGRGGSNIVADCPERLDPKRSILGFKQEDWLAKSLKDSPAIWDIIVQQTLMAQVVRPGRKFWTDGWDGYPAARKRLLEAASQRAGANPLVVGGDIHAYAVADLKLDFDDSQAPVIATEICGTSISSQGPDLKATDEWMKANPHIKFFNGTSRGYVTVTLNKEEAKIALRAIETEKRPDAGISTVASFVVERGKPGARRIASL